MPTALDDSSPVVDQSTDAPPKPEPETDPTLSKLEAKMRAEGKIITRDFMSPEDREWLEMDIEDCVRLFESRYEIPFYENDECIRQFGEKPEAWGPYGDPQHPYFCEVEDVWMALGFINQFYEVLDFWKMYVHEVDQEREMWLNSFYKAPLRLPIPAELEYWWLKNHDPEFVLINKEREPDPNDPSKLIYMEAPLILHVPSGHIINCVEDEKHGIHLFWQPVEREGRGRPFKG